MLSSKRTKMDFDGFVQTFKQDGKLGHNEIKVGFLFYLKSKHQSTGVFKSANSLNTAIAEDLLEIVSGHEFIISKVAFSVGQVLDKTKKKKNYERDWLSIVDLLNSFYTFPASKSASGHTSVALSDASAVPAVEPLTYADTDCTGEVGVTKLRNNCSFCKHKRRTIQNLVCKNNDLKEKLEETKQLKRTSKILRRALSRKNKIEVDLRDDRRTLRKTCASHECTITNLNAETEKLKEDKSSKNLAISRSKLKYEYEKRKDKKDAEIKDLLEQNKALKNQIKKQDELLENIKCELEELEESSKLDQQSKPTKSNKKSYSFEFRKAAYHCILNQVPVETTAYVIKSVMKQLNDTDLEQLPHPTTICYFAYELGVLSDIQSCETMISQDNITLAWDATSLDGEHVNEVHFNVHDGDKITSYVLQIDTLPGGTTSDYATQIVNSIKDAAISYSLCYDKDFNVVYSDVQHHLKNTITDRVSVNHCVVKQIESDLDIELLELNCNIHPLEGLSKSAESSSKSLDQKYEIASDTFGSSCRLVNLILALNKMRYKAGKGDPSGFKLFLKNYNIKSGLIVRYVGNRWHVAFHLSGVYFHLRDKLIIYLKSECNNNTTLRTAILKDLENPKIILFLQIFGLICKLISGPWMRVLYGNPKNSSHLEAVPIIQLCVRNVKQLQENPGLVMTQTTDVFGEKLDDNTDPILKSVRSNQETSAVFTDIMQTILSGFVVVLERQLENYLTGALSKPSAEMIKQTLSAPIHNVHAERVMALTDHQYRRARNATSGYIDGKVKAKQNRTLDWLDSKPLAEQNMVMKFVMKRGRQIRKLRKERESRNFLIKNERLKHKKLKVDTLFMNKIQRKIESVLQSGEHHQLAEELVDISQERLQATLSIIDDPSSVVGRHVEHTWYDDVDKDVELVYFGKILKVKDKVKNKQKDKIKYKQVIPVYTIAYWLRDSEDETESVDFDFELPQVICDLYTGTLIFIE